MGVFQASVSVSGQNMLLDFAPRPEERPTYVGLGNTALAPVFFATPLAAGMVADAVGLVPVFAIALVGGIAGTALLVLRVRDPRARSGSMRE
jgi:MFS family permease